MPETINSAINRVGSHSVKWDDAKKKFGTDDLLPLWVADMDLASPFCVQEAIQKRAKHPVYGYTIYPESYYTAIQNWMQKRFDWHIEKKWIVPCYGVVSSLNFAITAYTQEGDGIIIQTPIYAPFMSSVLHKKRKVLDNMLIYKECVYSIDFVDFEAKAQEAKLFLLCSPHNPTGRVWDKEELLKMIEICVDHNVIIISDEIHADVVYEKSHHPIGTFSKIMQQSVLLNAPSKTFNIAGLNTSYAIISDDRLRRAYKAEQNKSGITNGNPFGIEALMAAYDEGEDWLEMLKTHLQSNIDYVKMFLRVEKLPIITVETEATFLIWLDCKGLGLSQEELVSFFVNEAKLGLNNGMDFGDNAKGFMRLNVGTSSVVLEEAMQRLSLAYRRMS